MLIRRMVAATTRLTRVREEEVFIGACGEWRERLRKLRIGLTV